MPLSRFDGREPVETTTYEHDGDGRLIRSVTVREPEWTEQDRAWVLALGLWRSQQCPIHHGPLSECTSNYETGTQFTVSRIRCRARDAVLAEQEAMKNVDRPAALLWSVQAR